MHRNKAGMKAQQDYPTLENGGKERQEDYSTYVDAVICNRCRVILLSFFSYIFHSRLVILCFHPFFVSIHLTAPSLYVFFNWKKILPLVYYSVHLYLHRLLCTLVTIFHYNDCPECVVSGTECYNG